MSKTQLSPGPLWNEDGTRQRNPRKRVARRLYHPVVRGGAGQGRGAVLGLTLHRYS